MTYDPYKPKRYVSLEHHHGYSPRYRSRRRSSSSIGCGFLKCCCCCFYSCCRCCICTVFVLFIILVAIAIALYYFLRPNIPSYDIENIDVNNFDIRNDHKVYTDITLVVKAENPNADIGLNYLENEVRMMYAGSQLCSGQFPSFLQPEQNTTIVNLALKGETDLTPEMQHQFEQDKKEKNIPLLIIVTLPIRLVIDDIVHLKKFVVNVNCSLVIDQVQPKTKPNILEKEFTYGIEF